MSDTTPAEVKAEETVTELEKFEAERVDGVANPANGFPILMMKALPEAPPLPTAPLAPPATTGADPIDVAELAKAVAAELAKAEVRNPTNQTVAVGATSVNTESAGTKRKKGGLSKADVQQLVDDAVTKATKGAKEEAESLRAELAKVRATPIPGGPVMSIATSPMGTPQAEDRARKAAYYRDMAQSVTDPDLADSYRQAAARQLEGETAATG